MKRNFRSIVILGAVLALVVLARSFRLKNDSELSLDGLRYGASKTRVLETLGSPQKILPPTSERGEFLVFSFPVYDPEQLAEPPLVCLDRQGKLIEFRAKDMQIVVNDKLVATKGAPFSSLTDRIGKPDIFREFGSKEFYEKELENPMERTFAYFSTYHLAIECQHGRIERAALVDKRRFETKWY